MWSRAIRSLPAILLLCCLPLSPVMAQQTDPRALLHLLDYIGVDYPNTVQDGRIIGIVTRSDVMRYWYDLVPD